MGGREGPDKGGRGKESERRGVSSPYGWVQPGNSHQVNWPGEGEGEGWTQKGEQPSCLSASLFLSLSLSLSLFLCKFICCLLFSLFLSRSYIIFIRKKYIIPVLRDNFIMQFIFNLQKKNKLLEIVIAGKQKI